uniref:recombination regulator RecX n=1 Tax=Orrella sp. TaxID=1921583 RepID=UPI0040478E55
MFNQRRSDSDASFVADSLLSKRALKAKAVGLLAVREYTRAELLKKLSPLAQTPETLIAVLDELAQGGWQSDERFAAAFSHHKSHKQGAALVAQGMRQKGVSDALIAQTLQNLSATEQTRALSVWEKKFAREGRPNDARSWARQARFLASRGFGSAVIRKVLGSTGACEDDA